MPIISKHWTDENIKSPAKPINAPLIKEYTGVENYKGRADQIKDIMKYITVENYRDMRRRVKELLAERKKIGEIERGQAAVTPAFALSVKYVIHTVGSSWIDGNHGECNTLSAYYENSLEKAVELHCKSIVFSLIATGVYGFPKDRALQIAVSVISRFLLSNEMDVMLVVFDRQATLNYRGELFTLKSKNINVTCAYVNHLTKRMPKS